MHGGGVPAVAGDADEAHQTFLAGLDQGLQGTARAQRLVPFVGMDQGVQLQQIDVVSAQAV